MFKLFIVASFITIQNVFAGQVSGGISGGGGELITGTPIGKYRIESMLNDAKAVAYYYYSATKKQPISVNTYSPIFEIIKNTNISIENNGPCYDSEGAAMDGSVYSNSPNTICISTYQLGQKLSEDNAWVQTMALVIHEYSHLIGANEEQADRIQEQAIFQLGSKVLLPLRDTRTIYTNFINEWSSLQKTIPNLTKLKTNEDYQALMEFLRIGTFSGVEDFYHNLLIQSDYIFSVMSTANNNLVKTILKKLELIQIGAGFFVDQEIRNKYDEVFGNNKEMDVKDFMRQFDPSGKYRTGNFSNFDYVEGIKIIKISKYDDSENFRNDVVESLQSLRNDLSVVYKNVKATHIKLINLE